MKNRFFLFGLLGLFAISCVREQQESIVTLTDEPVFYGTVEDLGDPSTRVYANDQLRVRWDAGDHISIFNKTTYNREYAFQGETGDNSGSFKKVPNDDFFTGNDLDYIYAVYPYQESTKISDDGELTITLPAEQYYRENSFGLGANTMISVTEDNELHFKNVCGYFAVKLYGDNVSVKSISIKGNNNEPLAGKATVVAQTDAAPTLQMDPAEATKELTLTCATPVTLGSTAETATTFWVVIPPTTFTNGFTMTVTDSNNGSFVKTTSGSLEIKRNILKKSAALKVNIESQTTPTDPFDAIQFADPVAKYACVEKFDTNGDEEVSYGEAAAVTSLNGLFTNWNTVTRFDEIKYFSNVKSTVGLFTGLQYLKAITIPEQIIELGSFQGCSSLESVVIKSDLTTIPENCFSGCSSLEHVVLPEHLSAIPKNCFYMCSSLGQVSLPQTVSEINDYAFRMCGSLSSIVIPPQVTQIARFAFESCQALTRVVLPDKISIIETGAFYLCTSLVDITLPNSLTTINASAFFGCEFRTAKSEESSITIPENVDYIGNHAFCGVKNLILPKQGFVITEGEPVVKRYTNIFVPAEYLERYKVRTNWSKFAPQFYSIGESPSYPIATAVDLALPSGSKWASFNLGSRADDDLGLIYSWGETSMRWERSLEGYIFWISGGYINGDKSVQYSKYNYSTNNGVLDNKTTLEDEDDAAHILWGDGWHIPTKSDWEELMNPDNCIWSWTSEGGINGYRITSTKNENSIFLPEISWTSFYTPTGSIGSGVCGYWTASLYTAPAVPWAAYYISVENNSYSITTIARETPMYIRPIFR